MFFSIPWSKSTNDKWGLVKVAFDMIEFVCITKNDTSEKCKKYLEQRKMLIAKVNQSNVIDHLLMQVANQLHFTM